MKKLFFLICALFLTLNTYAQWSDDPTRNLQLSNVDKIYGHEIMATSNGDYYLYYESPDGFIKKYLQLYNEKGEKQWSEDLLISDHATLSWTQVNEVLFVDKDDNAIIMISDTRNDTASGERYRLSYSVYKVSPEGEQLWGDDGVPLTPNETFDIIAAIKGTQILDGSYVFVWSVPVSGGGDAEASIESVYNSDINIATAAYEAAALETETNTLDKAYWRIQMQRLSKDGVALWKDKTIHEEATDCTYAYLEDAGNNEFFVAYVKGANQDIYVRKCDPDANPVWENDAVVHTAGGFATSPIWTNLKSAPATDGILLGWCDDRDGDRYEDAYCAYITGDGTHGFSAGVGGQKLGYHPLRQFPPAIVFDKVNSCIYAAWNESSAGQGWQRITSQKLSLDGAFQWDSEGIAVAKLDQVPLTFHSIQLGIKNTVCTFYMRNNDNYGNTSVFATLQNADGSMVWADTAIELSSSVTGKGSLESTVFANNQWVCAWSEERGGIDTIPFSDSINVVAQNLNIDGTLGYKVVSNETIIKANDDMQLTIFPNPTTDICNIEIANKLQANTKVNIDIIDISGRRIENIFNGNIATGKSLIEYKVKNLKPGLYFIKITSNNGVYSSKLVVK